MHSITSNLTHQMIRALVWLKQQHPRRNQHHCRPHLPDDRGAVTAEYAVVIMGAVAFAAVLVAIMQSAEVRGFLLDLVQRALGSAG